ncbi:hypothetical protein ACVISU_004155 [Bradyrhizobium sp. USDA 4452]
MLALRPRAACRGVLRERRCPALPVLRHPGPASAACARDLRRAPVYPGVVVLRQAAAGSASDVRAPLPVAVASQASRAPLQAAPAVRVQPAAVALLASRPVARVARVRLPAEAAPGALRAVRAVQERPAEQGVRARPRAAEAERGVQARLRAELAASDAARPPEVAVSDEQAQLPEVAPADAVRLRAEPDARERPARAAAWAFRRVRALPLAALVRRPAAKFVRATLRRRIASPSAQSWRAARDEALSWYWSPRAESLGRRESESRTIRQDDELPAVRPDCGEHRIIGEVYFDIITGCMCLCSLAIQKKRSDTLAIDVELRRARESAGCGAICRRRWTGWSGRSAHR